MTLKLVMIRCPDNVAPERREVRGGEFSIGRGQGNRMGRCRSRAPPVEEALPVRLRRRRMGAARSQHQRHVPQPGQRPHRPGRAARSCATATGSSSASTRSKSPSTRRRAPCARQASLASDRHADRGAECCADSSLPTMPRRRSGRSMLDSPIRRSCRRISIRWRPIRSRSRDRPNPIMHQRFESAFRPPGAGRDHSRRLGRRPAGRRPRPQRRAAAAERRRPKTQPPRQQRASAGRRRRQQRHRRGSRRCRRGRGLPAWRRRSATQT